MPAVSIPQAPLTLDRLLWPDPPTESDGVISFKFHIKVVLWNKTVNWLSLAPLPFD